jgi:hypothetical protein
MKTMDALNDFIAQLERNVSLGEDKTKVVLTPSSVNEKGLVIKVGLKKTYLSAQTQARTTRILKIRLAVCGTIESVTGLSQAVNAIEALDTYFEKLRHLENLTGDKLADTRIMQTVSQEDSFIDSPDSIEEQEALDERVITITIPA